MITLKRQPKSGNQEMWINFLLQSDTLPLVSKLCAFWVSAGQDKDRLRATLTQAIHDLDNPRPSGSRGDTVGTIV
jgi:hypothetical protein